MSSRDVEAIVMVVSTDVTALRCEVEDRASVLAGGTASARELVLLAGACLELARALDPGSVSLLSDALGAVLLAVPPVSGR